MTCPVRVLADDGADRADRRAQLAKVVADIGERIQHLDIAMASGSDDANVVVNLVRDRDLSRTITSFYGQRTRQGNSRLARSAMPIRISARTSRFEIEHSDVILTVDSGDFIFPRLRL